MKVAIYGQSFQPEDQQCVEELLDELKKSSASIYVEENFNKLVGNILKEEVKGTFTQSEGLDPSFDMFVSFGGDGTCLLYTSPSPRD